MPAGTDELLDLALTAATAAGDLLLAVIGNQSGLYRSVAPPTGWTAVPNTDYSDGNAVRSHAFYKVASSLEPASYTFTLTGGSGQAMAGGILDITGASTGAPINASLGQVTSKAATSLPAPSITTTVANTLLVYGVLTNSSISATQPPLMTEKWDIATTGPYNVSNETAVQTFTATGATGTRAASFLTKQHGVAILIAIAPA
jgi:MSHA biogenesis protein MshQ